MLPSNDVLYAHAKKCVDKAVLWVEHKGYRRDYTNEQWLFAGPLLVKDRAITWMRMSFGEDFLKNGRAEVIVDSVYPVGVEAFHRWCAYFDRYWERIGVKRQPQERIVARPRYYPTIFKRREG